MALIRPSLISYADPQHRHLSGPTARPIAGLREGGRFALKVASDPESCIITTCNKSRAGKMVEWTDFERATIADIFAKMNYEDVGPATLAR